MSKWAVAMVKISEGDDPDEEAIADLIENGIETGKARFFIERDERGDHAE